MSPLMVDSNALVQKNGASLCGVATMLSIVRFCVLPWGLAACMLALAQVPGKAAEPANDVGDQREAQALLARQQSGELARMSNEQLVQTSRQTSLPAVITYLELGCKPLAEYELWMQRQELLPDGWTERPFLNYVKYRHQPRQVYMSWLTGGARAGQEMIFDETRRKDATYGHLAGMWNVTSIWTALDGSLAKSNSNHSVLELGLQGTVDMIRREQEQFRRTGQSYSTESIDVLDVAGHRTVALTWLAPTGAVRSYAQKTKVYLDLQLPIIRQIESWGRNGQMRERILFERVKAAQFTSVDFSPTNQGYAF